MKIIYKQTRNIIEFWADGVIEKAQSNILLRGFAGQRSTRRIECTGSLRLSLGKIYKENLENGLITVDFGSTNPEAASIVEQGRNANNRQAPQGTFERWIKDKGIRLQRVYINKNGQKVSEFIPQTEKNIRQSAFTMSRASAKKGIKGRPFFRNAMESKFAELPEPLAFALVSDMEDFIIDDFTKNKVFSNVKKI